jgi:hypothetical protein
LIRRAFYRTRDTLASLTRVYVTRLAGDQLATPHRRLLVRLARRAHAFRLPLPLAIVPDREVWIIRVSNRDALVRWAHALGHKPMMVEFVPGMRENFGLWVLKATVYGIPVHIMARPERREPTVDNGAQP